MHINHFHLILILFLANCHLSHSIKFRKKHYPCPSTMIVYEIIRLSTTHVHQVMRFPFTPGKFPIICRAFDVGLTRLIRSFNHSRPLSTDELLLSG